MRFASCGCAACGKWRCRVFQGPHVEAEHAAWLLEPCPSCGAPACPECEGVHHAPGEHLDPRTGEPRG